MPLALDVKPMTMAWVAVPPHPDCPSVRRAINPDSNVATAIRFTKPPARRSPNFSRVFPGKYHAAAVWLPQVTEVLICPVVAECGNVQGEFQRNNRGSIVVAVALVPIAN